MITDTVEMESDTHLTIKLPDGHLVVITHLSDFASHVLVYPDSDSNPLAMIDLGQAR